MGLFALLCGAAFVTTLDAFLDESTQALTVPPPQPVNISQLLIRPLFLEFGLAALVVLPLITIRGMGELGEASRARGAWKVVGVGYSRVFAIYVLMLLVTMPLMGVLFVYGQPEWPSMVTGYLGLLLIGAAFASVGLLISSFASSVMAAGIATFAVSFALAGAAWLAQSGASIIQPLLRHLSAGDVLDDFAKGIIDTGHVVSCLSITVLGLFLASQVVAVRLRRDTAAAAARTSNEPPRAMPAT